MKKPTAKQYATALSGEKRTYGPRDPILDTPMQGGIPSEGEDLQEEAINEIGRQYLERINAAYRYFEIDPKSPDAKDRLIDALCAEQFPIAFDFGRLKLWRIHHKPGQA